MGCLHVILVDNCILHCRINLRVPKDFLHLFYRHSLIYGSRCHCSPKFMRMNPLRADTSAKFTQAYFNAADFQACMRRIERYKQRRIVVVTFCQIVEQMQFCFGVKIYPPLLVPLYRRQCTRVLQNRRRKCLAAQVRRRAYQSNKANPA